MRLTTKLLAAAVLAVALVPASASARGTCPARSGTLARDSLGRIWHSGTSLYGCTTVYGHSPRARRLGPYRRGVRVAFDGVNVAWTAPLVRGGVRSDRVYAANVDSGQRWLVGRLLVPATADTAEHEARLQALRVRDQSVAWVTTAGDVVLATREPQGEPETIGTLPTAPTEDRNLLLVGSFPDAGAPALARSVRFEEEDGEGDECGGVNPYVLTVDPDGSGTRVGVRWFGYWTSTNCR